MIARGRLAQCFGRRRKVRRADRARARRRGLYDRVGTRPRHRRRGPSLEPCERHGRGAGRRPRSHLSGRACSAAGADPADRRRHHRNAARLGAARPRLPPPQPADLRPVGRRRHRRGGAPLGLADHRADGERTRPRGVRGAGLAARSARRGHQRPAQAGRDAGHRGRRRAGGDPPDPGPAHRAIGRGTGRRPAPPDRARRPTSAPASSACSAPRP